MSSLRGLVGAEVATEGKLMVFNMDLVGCCCCWSCLLLSSDETLLFGLLTGDGKLTDNCVESLRCVTIRGNFWISLLLPDSVRNKMFLSHQVVLHYLCESFALPTSCSTGRSMKAASIHVRPISTWSASFFQCSRFSRHDTYTGLTQGNVSARAYTNQSYRHT